jgi:hypothetical protein
MKTSELTGAKLDLWVARALELEPIIGEPEGFFFWNDDNGLHSGWFAPSTDWAQGGPLIALHKINLECPIGDWYASIKIGPADVACGAGPTPLIAAMRAYVSGTIGDTVPDEAE